MPVASPAAAISDAAAKPALAAVGCESLHFDLATCERLDNKHAFASGRARSWRLPAPATVLLESARTRARSTPRSPRRPRARPPRASARARATCSRTSSTTRSTGSTSSSCRARPTRSTVTSPSLTGPFALSPATPWQAQRFLVGPEYTAFAVLREGAVRQR